MKVMIKLWGRQKRPIFAHFCAHVMRFFTQKQRQNICQTNQ